MQRVHSWRLRGSGSGGSGIILSGEPTTVPHHRIHIAHCREIRVGTKTFLLFLRVRSVLCVTVHIL